jgi:N-hydroxyarylamine O-acetyltransferase
MCLYHQTSPDSPFTQRRLITLPTPTGRITLTSEKFLAKDGRQIKLETIENEEAFYAKLEEVFGYATQNILVELNK